MNPINELFDSMTDEELCQAVKEIKADTDADLGIVCDGVVRKYAKKINEITGSIGGVIALNLFMSETAILRQAAFRFTKIK